MFDWSESPTSHNKQFLVNAKKDIQKKIQDEIGVQWDFPDPTGKGGTSTTGNTARNILHHSRQLVVEMVPAAYQATMKFGQQLSVILRVLCSSELVNVKDYKKLCTELYFFLIRSFPRVIKKHLPGPWISITPSLHKLLAHSWELIELNGDPRYEES